MKVWLATTKEFKEVVANFKEVRNRFHINEDYEAGTVRIVDATTGKSVFMGLQKDPRTWIVRYDPTYFEGEPSSGKIGPETEMVLKVSDPNDPDDFTIYHSLSDKKRQELKRFYTKKGWIIEEFERPISERKSSSPDAPKKENPIQWVTVTGMFETEIEDVSYEFEYEANLYFGSGRFPDRIVVEKPSDMPDEIWDKHFEDIEETAIEKAHEEYRKGEKDNSPKSGNPGSDDQLTIEGVLERYG